MKPDSDEWNYFVESLWPYQFTRHPLPWDSAEGKAARDALYETSQGIADFVVKVWILGHFRAMDSGEERLTAEVLRSAVTDHLKLSQSIMDLIAANQWTELQRYEDVYYPGLEQWRPNVPPQDIDVETAIITWLEAGGIPESIAIESARDASRKAETSDLMTLRQQAYQAALTKLAEASTPKDNATKSHRGKSKPAQKSSKTKDPLTESDLYADPKEWTTP